MRFPGKSPEKQQYPNPQNFRQKNWIFLFFRVKLSSRYPVNPNDLIDEKEKPIMSNKSNKLNVPEARAAMDKFKMEAASDLRVPPPS